MLKIVCPYCQSEMSLAKFKPGKFAPQCKKCQKKFRLLIVQQADQSFAAKTGKLPVTPSATAPSQPAPKDSPTVASDQSNTDFDETVAPVAQPTADLDVTAASNSSAESKNKSAPTSGRPVPQDRTRSDSHTAHASREIKARGTVADDFEVASDASTDTPMIGRTLGPYRLLKILGQGGMGSVYLAKQTSLDRNVALKVIKSNLADRPSMMARFTREAYAAAQLVHPNVVQIYDMGDDKGNCFFSMELVDGSSLSDLVGGDKKLDPQQAASYILHAARGLECAHNAGMVHRDIKPANLLVDSSGIVKVADLGLVKVPDEEEIEDQDDIAAASALSASKDLTRFGSTVGTPYYMAPEQAKNAVFVDHRADIYSLGCTFYVLLTGKRPFDGKSVEEVASKHSSEPLVLPTKLVSRVPAELSSIVQKMMEKSPDDRYQTSSALIKDLESFLGISNAADFTPDEADADQLENNAISFHGVALTKLRGVLPLALVAACVLISILLLFVSWRWATGFLLLPLAALISYFVFSGIRDDSNLFSKIREIVFQSGWISWLKWLAAGLLLIIASFLVGAFVPWLLMTAVGLGIGVAYFFLIDKAIQRARQSAIEDTNSLLKKLRLKGMEESTIQLFVAKYSGNQWEEFFENLFGYEAKRRVRDELNRTEIGKKRPRFWAWRDRISDRLASLIETADTEKEKQHLQKVETAGLVAQGVSAADARDQATQMAAALVDHGDSIRVAALQKRIADMDPEAQRLKQRLKVKAMLAEARSGKYAQPKSLLQRITPTLNRTVGQFTRFLAGCLLIVGCLLWARQNNLLSAIQSTVGDATAAFAADDATGDDANVDDVVGDDVANAETTKTAVSEQLMETMNQATKPLKVPILGGLFFRNFNALIAGLILVFSALFFGWRMSLFAFPAAAIALWGGMLGIPQLFSLSTVDPVSGLIGVGILVLGVFVGRMED